MSELASIMGAACCCGSRPTTYPILAYLGTRTYVGTQGGYQEQEVFFPAYDDWLNGVCSGAGVGIDCCILWNNTWTPCIWSPNPFIIGYGACYTLSGPYVVQYDTSNPFGVTWNGNTYPLLTIGGNTLGGQVRITEDCQRCADYIELPDQTTWPIYTDCQQPVEYELLESCDCNPPGTPSYASALAGTITAQVVSDIGSQRCWRKTGQIIQNPVGPVITPMQGYSQCSFCCDDLEPGAPCTEVCEDQCADVYNLVVSNLSAVVCGNATCTCFGQVSVPNTSITIERVIDTCTWTGSASVNNLPGPVCNGQQTTVTVTMTATVFCTTTGIPAGTPKYRLTFTARFVNNQTSQGFECNMSFRSPGIGCLIHQIFALDPYTFPDPTCQNNEVSAPGLWIT